MALSGSNYKSFARHRLVTEWTATQNIANNQSTVTVKVFLQSVDAYGAMNAPASNAGRVKVGTTTKNFTATSHLSANQKKQLTSQSFVVSHNADGTGSFSYSVTYNINVTFSGVFYGNQTVSGTGTLNTIPRASSISSISGGTLGSTLTVNISRASSSFTHKVGYYRTNGTREMAIINNVGTSTSFTLPLSDASLLPSATTGTAKIVVDTYNGSTKIGSASKTFKVTVPSSVVPTIKTFNLNENITATKNIGLAANTFVKNKSQISMTASADGSYSSTIKDYTFSFNGASQGGTVGRQFNVGNITGNHTAKVVVKDSRGRTAERTITANILDYSPPKINGFSTWRDGTGVVKANVNCSITILGGKGGTWYVDSGGTGWTNRNTGSLTTDAPSYSSNITVVGTYSDSSSATFRLRVSDAFGAGPTAIASVSTSKTALSLYKDVGIGVGKRWEKGALDVGGDVHILGNLNSKGYHKLTAGSTAASGNDGLLHLNRANDTTVAVWTSVGAEGNLCLNLYNKTGAWTKAHNFMHSGRVELNGDLSVGGEITSNNRPIRASEFFANGAKVHADYTPPLLWSGSLYMTETHEAVPSKTITSCRNGWVLYWSDYTGGVANNYDWNMTFIPKSANTQNINGFHAIIGTDSNQAPISKYLYFREDKILGAAGNSSDNKGNAVLRAIYEW